LCSSDDGDIALRDLLLEDLAFFLDEALYSFTLLAFRLLLELLEDFLQAFGVPPGLLQVFLYARG
jgi:hypothetical protein